MTATTRRGLGQRARAVGALLAVGTLVLCGAGTARAADADARFRELLRARLQSSAAPAHDQVRLLGIADEVAEAAYADLDRAETAATEFRALPLAAENWRERGHGGERVRPQPDQAREQAPLWTKPWSAVATAERAVQWHEAATRPPSAVAFAALLAQLSPPTIARANGDWREPILIIEGVEALHILGLRWRQAAQRYEVQWLERRTLLEGQGGY